MTRGIEPGRRRTSRYGLEGRPAAASLTTALVRAADSLIELGRGLRRAEGEIAALGDARSGLASDSLGAASRDADQAGRLLWDAFRKFEAEVAAVAASVGPRVDVGTLTHAIAGVGAANYNHDVAAGTWITANTVAFGWYAGNPVAGATSVGEVVCIQDPGFTFPGISFRMVISIPAGVTTPGGNQTFNWVAFTP